MPRDAEARAQVEKIVEEAIVAEGQKLLAGVMCRSTTPASARA